MLFLINITQYVINNFHETKTKRDKKHLKVIFRWVGNPERSWLTAAGWQFNVRSKLTTPIFRLVKLFYDLIKLHTFTVFYC